jgi:hypothetical protein
MSIPRSRAATKINETCSDLIASDLQMAVYSFESFTIRTSVRIALFIIITHIRYLCRIL